MSKEARIYPFNLEFKNEEDIPYFAEFPLIFDGEPVKEIICGISSRLAGDMKYEEGNKNRDFLFKSLGLNPLKVYGLNQIHSHYVLAAKSSNNMPQEGDGMVSDDRGLTLSVTVADCLPIYLYDTGSGAFGIVHSGWKGTGIVLAALDLMKKNWGTLYDDAAAVLGPCIGACCYNVDIKRALAFKNKFGEESVLTANGIADNKIFSIDLKAANIKLLKEAGVQHIAVCNDCTCCGNKLGSFRREKDNFTRMAALINF